MRIAFAIVVLLTGFTTAGGVSAEQLRDFVATAPDLEDQISLFVRRILQDHRGDLWMGTNGDGVLRYDGETLERFSVDRGFGGVAVRGIVEDDDGDLWFGTERGLTRYDGTTFTHYTEADGLVGHDVWSLALDDQGVLWIGTLAGVTRYHGSRFMPFDLPEVEPDWERGVASSRLVNSILQDSRGRMWFATGGGVFVQDAGVLRHFTVDDGLCGDSVNDILEDADGDFWFATHHHGVCRFDGETFTPVTEADGVYGTEVWSLTTDRAGNVWFPVEGFGVYRYDGSEFARYHRDQGLASGAIQCIYQDREGRLWCGGYMGLYRLEGDAFVNVTRDGPWR
jgi:ligand-binding sensor domain-containing protein